LASGWFPPRLTSRKDSNTTGAAIGSPCGWSVSTGPIPSSSSSKRQVNDKFDAQVMCRRLSEYLAGHRKALSRGAHSFARGGGTTRAGADARPIAAADPAHAGDGTQPFAAKGNGGERALVEGYNLDADYPEDASLGCRAAGDLKETHRVHREGGAEERIAAQGGRAARAHLWPRRAHS
jgi:hypothetical protein